MKERNINQTAVSLNERFNDASNSLNTQYYLTSLDVNDSKELEPNRLVMKKSPPKNTCKTSFDSKTIEESNPSHIFLYPEVRAALSNKSVQFNTKTVFEVYSLTNITGSKICNLF